MRRGTLPVAGLEGRIVACPLNDARFEGRKRRVIVAHLGGVLKAETRAVCIVVDGADHNGQRDLALKDPVDQSNDKAVN